MSIKFKPIARRNPLDPEAEEKFYPFPVPGHAIEFFQLAELLSDGCTLGEADIVAVLIRLEAVIGRELAMGNRIKLGNLGTFYISFDGKPADSPLEVSADKIKQTKIHFRPSKRMKQKLNQTSYIKV